MTLYFRRAIAQYGRIKFGYLVRPMPITETFGPDVEAACARRKPYLSWRAGFLLYDKGERGQIGARKSRRDFRALSEEHKPLDNVEVKDRSLRDSLRIWELGLSVGEGGAAFGAFDAFEGEFEDGF